MFPVPVATPEARRDLMVGGTLLLALPIGWILNLGHRLEVVGRVNRHERPHFRGFAPWGRTFRRGLQAFAAISLYLSPGAALGAASWLCWRSGAAGVAGALAALGGLAFVVAVYALPGGMTYNAAFDDMSYLYRPDKALRRAVGGGGAYLKGWAIALAAIGLSLLGGVALGVGVFYSSVWAWSVVGYAFSRALVLPEPAEPAARRELP